jgi:hypothetical protein
MTISAADIGDMIARAAEQVRAGWKPTPTGSYLSTLVTEDQPPLTTGAVDMYLAFYAWLRGEEPPADEANQVRERLTRDSQTAWVRMDWSVRDAVLSTCALWDQIRERPDEEQETIRSFLREQIEPGSYPELEARPKPGVATAVENVEDYMNTEAARHRTIMQVLRTWPQMPR